MSYWEYSETLSALLLFAFCILLERNVLIEIDIFVYKLEFDYSFDKSTRILLIIAK